MVLQIFSRLRAERKNGYHYVWYCEVKWDELALIFAYGSDSNRNKKSLSFLLFKKLWHTSFGFITLADNIFRLDIYSHIYVSMSIQGKFQTTFVTGLILPLTICIQENWIVTLIMRMTRCPQIPTYFCSYTILFSMSKSLAVETAAVSGILIFPYVFIYFFSPNFRKSLFKKFICLTPTY